MSQVCELTEQLCAIQADRDSLLSSQTQQEEELQLLRDSLQTSQDEILRNQADVSAAALREEQLNQLCADATRQLDSLRSELQCCDTEKTQLIATTEQTVLKVSYSCSEIIQSSSFIEIFYPLIGHDVKNTAARIKWS